VYRQDLHRRAAAILPYEPNRGGDFEERSQLPNELRASGFFEKKPIWERIHRGMKLQN
jgi:hypothetical protein